jgi:hypothetical protein
MVCDEEWSLKRQISCRFARSGFNKAVTLTPNNVPTSTVPSRNFSNMDWYKIHTLYRVSVPPGCWDQSKLMYSLLLPKDNTFKGPNLKGR